MTVEHDWHRQRDELLGHRISDLALQIRGTRVEALVERLYAELEARGLKYRPGVYLSDQWGCPDGTPLIGVPFYLADQRLERIEAEMSMSIESDDEAMRYMRHEAGHAFNYAFRLHDRPEWQQTFGAFRKPYRDRYRADPFSREYVRHILAWYAQKHPDEDFAETFAVWLTPQLDWRTEYDGWPALRKLEYVEHVMREIASEQLEPVAPTEDDLPVEAMQYTLAEHYESEHDRIPVADERVFDVDLRQIFFDESAAPAAGHADAFLRRHCREVVSRTAYWTSEHPSVVRSLMDLLVKRAEALRLRVGRVEAATLIELTSFVTAVVMMHRYTHIIGRPRSRRAPQS
ncbi:MAG TPA: putative zinc-binding metallopeptidase [Gemmatimonadaceae bacterium]|nr:putative zinc-binding metallopeptidase [Gemmatimonadaceae bacterium]